MRSLRLSHRAAALVGPVLAEQHDEWAQGHRYLGLEVLERSRITAADTTTDTGHVPLSQPDNHRRSRVSHPGLAAASDPRHIVAVAGAARRDLQRVSMSGGGPRASARAGDRRNLRHRRACSSQSNSAWVESTPLHSRMTRSSSPSV